jgi:hypothetical protein
LEFVVSYHGGIEGVSNRLPDGGAELAWAYVVGGVGALLESHFMSDEGRDMLLGVMRRAYTTGVEASMRSRR